MLNSSLVHIFIFSFLVCSQLLYSQTNESLVRLKQKAISDAVVWLDEKFKDFDPLCFLLGCMDDENGHFQTFTSNKSILEINENVRWMYDEGLKFVPDTMACKRVTSFGNAISNLDVALFIVALLKNDYPDLRCNRVCYDCCPTEVHYGNEIRSSYDDEDPVCKKDFNIELFSTPLSKTVERYYIFDKSEKSQRILSSGGDIGFRGTLNMSLITKEEQKQSFLLGVFLRYGINNYDKVFSIPIPSSLNTAQVCMQLLKGLECKNVVYFEDHIGKSQLYFTSSVKVTQLILLANNLQNEINKGIIAF